MVGETVGPDATAEVRVPPPGALDSAALQAGGSAATSWALLSVWSALLIAFVLVPVFLLRPFHPQTLLGLAAAYEMRRTAPTLTSLGLLPIAALVYSIARGRRLRWRWAPLTGLVALAAGTIWFAHQDHFEWMFHPLPSARFVRATEATFPQDGDMVLAVETPEDDVAYPVRELAYHHLVMDTVDGVPVVATYCTLCHTGLVWRRAVDTRVLTFRLYGINNQNMVMRDDQTGSWWQQATGEAIQGPLRGRRLEPFMHDEISFAVFKRERPWGRVLRPSPEFEKEYARANWERRMKKAPTVTPMRAGDPWAPRMHVLGVEIGGRARAYSFPSIRKGGPVNDVVGGVAIVVVVGEDHKSVRVFERTVGDRRLEFVAREGVRPIVLADLQTGSEWDFSGKATAGQLAGTSLRKVLASKEYWFDWKLHRPGTSTYTRPGPKEPS
jgi:Protein of unknown function (DUF3179)